MAATECEREARKRRERRDSGSAHERKERRPHSEERAIHPHPLHDYNRLESERRAERLSRARRPQLGKRRRGPARTHRNPKENDCTSDSERQSPVHFDYLTIKPQVYEEIERPEVEETCEALGEAARRDERLAAPRLAPRRDAPGPGRTLDKINKKISVLKKNISNYETDFEVENGYAMTPTERITDVQLTRMYENLKRLQAEKRCIKTDPVEYALRIQAAKVQKERDDKLDEALKSDKSMTDVVADIEEWLEGCRVAGGRSGPEARWTAAQLSAEKCCVQRALLRLEAARGRPPARSAERGAARPLYERYRCMKRALAPRPDLVLGCSNGELATIHEHETMLFNTSVDSSSDSQDKPTDSSQEVVEAGVASEAGSSSSGASCSERALHCLALDDLVRALADAQMHKCVLRRSIKEYEVNFELVNSRKVQRDDKKNREEDYQRYKSIKARIKLINALINKQKALANAK